jgi:hypothetical protein
VFAVAVLLIETWTGKAPFRRESFAASADALRELPPPLDRTDMRLAVLQPLISSALALAPEQRPQTAEELARPLREFIRQDDLGDLARRLGERVGELLRRGGAAPESAPSTVAGELSADARAACSSQLPTRTFAARPALLEWTAKIESVPPEASSHTSSGAVAIESGITAPREPSREGGPERRAARPVVAALAIGGALLLGLGGRAWLRAPSPHAADVLAAAPAAAPRVEARGAPEAAAAPASIAAGRGAAAENAPATVVSVPAPSSGAATVTAPPSRAPAAPVLPGSPAHTSRHSAARPAAGRADAAVAPRGLDASLSARLQLTAEPSAWVEIDATRVGRTPLSGLHVSPGRHAIRFENPLLGERLEAQVTLEPRGSARVHADFSSASPQVHVR